MVFSRYENSMSVFFALAASTALALGLCAGLCSVVLNMVPRRER